MRLSADLAMRHVVGGKAAPTVKQAASTREAGRFETKILSIGSNLKKLMDFRAQSKSPDRFSGRQRFTAPFFEANPKIPNAFRVSGPNLAFWRCLRENISLLWGLLRYHHPVRPW